MSESGPYSGVIHLASLYEPYMPYSYETPNVICVSLTGVVLVGRQSLKEVHGILVVSRNKKLSNF